MPAVKTPVVVALSGGVDSAVAALCLLRAGHAVEALHMTNWDDADEYCTAAADLAEARKVADDLGIPLHHVNFAREYREQVFADFLAEYRAGRTPNPDVACNRYIKFGAFLHHARRLGAEYIATGHYARVMHRGDQGHLYQAADADKDQTYFLHSVRSEALARTLFPLGDLQKSTVRAMAREYGLANHARADITGICFIGERPFREFLAQYIVAEPGPILTLDGQTIGQHSGLPYYTLGQRHGLNLGGQADKEQAAWFVAGRDPARNALIVVQGHDHPALLSSGLGVGELHWINAAPGELLSTGQVQLQVRLRHRQAVVGCVVRQTDQGDVLQLDFAVPQRAATPGQYAVFYAGEECLGGGVILATRSAA
ncbi:MAG: tRNA 2-thiouridine(34) synthase MnmA [Gammaproteobacteria bacterium]|nr:tRNA 2-thiouridine(34) synthase MnmA [Gammaproteobacteria bacterium]